MSTGDILLCPGCNAELRFNGAPDEKVNCPRCKRTIERPTPAADAVTELTTKGAFDKESSPVDAPTSIPAQPTPIGIARDRRSKPAAPVMSVPTEVGVAELAAKKPVGEAASLRRVAIGLGLVLAGIVAQILVACVAGVLWLWLTEPARILPAFRAASILPFALQVAGHCLCLSVPREVRIVRIRPDRTDVVEFKSGGKTYKFIRRPRGFPARNLIVGTLILDFLALLLLGWSEAAEFNLLRKPDWLPPAHFGLLVPLALWQMLVPLVLFSVPIALRRYAGRSQFAWWGQGVWIQAIAGSCLLLTIGARFLLAGQVQFVVFCAIVAIGLIFVYVGHIGLLLITAPALWAYANAKASDRAGSVAEALVTKDDDLPEGGASSDKYSE